MQFIVVLSGSAAVCDPHFDKHHYTELTLWQSDRRVLNAVAIHTARWAS